METRFKVISLLLSVVWMALFANSACAERKVVNNVDYIHQVKDMKRSEFLGYNACGPTSAVMMVNFYNVQKDSANATYPGWYVWNSYADFIDMSGKNYSTDLARDWDGIEEENTYNLHHPHEVCGAHGYMVFNSSSNPIIDPYWGTNRDKLKLYLENHGLKVSNRIEHNRFETIKQNIDVGLPLHGHVDCGYNCGHHLVIIGYDTGTEGDAQNVIVNDPYGDYNNGWNGTTEGIGVTYPLDGIAGTWDIEIDWVYTVHPIGIYNNFPGYHNEHTVSEFEPLSKPFVDCYNKNGGADSLGIPWDNGQSVFVHEWPSGSSSQDTIFLQDFITSDGHWYQLVLNQEMNKVFPVHNQILFFWHNNFGYLNYGEPICNEYYATDTFSLDKLTIQEFKKNGIVHYLGYNTKTGWSKEYEPYEFFDWEERGFYHYQTIPDDNAKADDKNLAVNKAILADGERNPKVQDWESFEINGEIYLAVANGYNGVNYNVDSIIYKWNNVSFVEFQKIQTSRANNWESFTINGEMYLAIANEYNGSSGNIYSKIYKWNGLLFIEFQAIPIYYATDWENFEINGETYLAVAANYNSKIYKWDGLSFIEFQEIPTYSATDWESFKINGETYLAVANRRDGSTGNSDIDSKIYKWDGSMFIEFQAILTHSAEDWESFKINGETYLVIANQYTKTSVYVDSIIYKWNGFSFVEFQAILIPGAKNWESFAIDGVVYLGLSYSSDSYSVYKWNGYLFTEFQTIGVDNPSESESFIINEKNYIIVAGYNSSKIYIMSDGSAHEEQMLIQQDETIETLAIIPNNCAKAEFLRIIKGSDVEMSLIDPNNIIIDRNINDPNIIHTLTDSNIYESYEITNPLSGEWTIRLIGTDVLSEGEETTLVVSIKPEPNESPIANAGDDQIIVIPEGSEIIVTLDGSNSTDPDNNISKFEWYEDTTKLGEGENLEISLEFGNHQIRLIVIDEAGNMDDDIVNISITMSEAILGDLNFDGRVDIQDWLLFCQDWKRTDCGTPAGSGCEPNDCECDMNYDGCCNIRDLRLFIRSWIEFLRNQ